MHTVLMGTAIRSNTPTQSQFGSTSRSAKGRRRAHPRKTLREVLASSGTRVMGDLANLYGDGELEESHATLEAQARRWAKAFESSTFLDAGI
ncbi:MAG TPA: hypothetical protein VMR75_03635 [Candidatus Saccharimonadales bacterium]|nr:hypothetical protein [Candidatus Saccharimonadales bacterium]